MQFILDSTGFHNRNASFILFIGSAWKIVFIVLS